MKRLYLATMSLVLFLNFSFLLMARPYTDEDQGYSIEKVDRKIEVFPDGQRYYYFFLKYKVLSEKGISSFGVYNIDFNSNTEKVEILNVEVKNGTDVKKIDVNNIEEKSLFGGYSGYDETKTKVIPLPNVVVGSEITVEYKHHVFRPEFPQVILGRDFFRYDTLVKDYYFELVYPNSAKIFLKDEKKLVSGVVQESKREDKNVFSFQIKNLPGLAGITENEAFISFEDFIWLDVTNLNSFEEAGLIARKGFDNVMGQPLPEFYGTLFGAKPLLELSQEGAKKALEEILKTISQKVRYFGDWRSVDGGYVPRNLNDVASTAYGDCKDFAVLVVKAAQYLGLQGEVLLVQRSFNPTQKQTIPNLGIFNHAIARVKIPGTEDYWWIDATNPIQNLGIIPTDIAGRQALALSQKPGLVDIPRDPINKTQHKTISEMDITHSPDIHLDFEVTMNGHNGWWVQDDLRGMSQKSIEEYFIDYVGINNADVEKFELKSFEKEESFPFPLRFHVQMVEKNGAQRSGNLKILSIMTFTSAPGRIMAVIPEDRTADLNLSYEEQGSVVQKIKRGTFSKVVGIPENCDIDSPWLSFKRNIVLEPDFEIKTETMTKKYSITLDEIKSEVFSKLQKDLRHCLNGVKVVVQ